MREKYSIQGAFEIICMEINSFVWICNGFRSAAIM